MYVALQISLLTLSLHQWPNLHTTYIYYPLLFTLLCAHHVLSLITVVLGNDNQWLLLSLSVHPHLYFISPFQGLNSHVVDQLTNTIDLGWLRAVGRRRRRGSLCMHVVHVFVWLWSVEAFVWTCKYICVHVCA